MLFDGGGGSVSLRRARARVGSARIPTACERRTSWDSSDPSRFSASATRVTVVSKSTRSAQSPRMVRSAIPVWDRVPFVEGDVAALEGFEGLDLDEVGVELESGVVDELVDGDEAGGGGDGCDGLVDVLDDVAGCAEDGAGDAVGPPDGDLPGADLRVEAGHAVADGQRVTEKRAACRGGHVVGGGEGCGGVPGDGWDAEPLDLVEVATRGGPVIHALTRDVGRSGCLPGLVAGRLGVGVGPRDREVEQRQRCVIGCCSRLSDADDEVGGGGRVVVDLVRVDRVGGHASSLVEDPFG